ncbi:MAG: hypothetical protein NTZ43_15005 [Gemmatimonadetes bacterium]|nr:hypothetical protein [Gemmatimonadota bacterium]
MRLVLRSILAACVVMGTARVAHAQAYRAQVALLGFAGPITMDTLAIPFELNAPPGKVFAALDAAFKGVSIPMTVRDSVRGIAGNASYRKMRNFANAPASKWLNCGAGMTGQNADEMRLTIAIIAIVDPGKSGGTVLRLGMAASAEDAIGQSKPAIGCASSGRLEAVMVDFIRKQTGS